MMVECFEWRADRAARPLLGTVEPEPTSQIRYQAASFL
jgi:hypothetical protein